MPSIKELYTALENADKAGDTAAAKELAAYIKALQPPSIISPVSATTIAPTPEKSGALRRAGDVGLGLLQGAIGLPESLVGLADIPTGGRVGKALEGVGYKPAEAKQILQEMKSPEQQAAERAVSEAQGVIPLIKAAGSNPSSISNAIAQSVPLMLGSAGIARGVLSVAPKVGAVVAGGIGEGAISAGAGAERARQESQTGELTGQQAGIAVVSGALTGVLGVLGGKVAQKLGIGDIDTLLAGGVNPAQKGRLLTSVIKSGLAEATFEELPQSMQEQIASNLSSGKPWDEGVAEAGAMGAITALPLGGAAGYSTYRAGQKEDERLSKILEPEQARIAALKREAATSEQYTSGFQAAAAEREADLVGKAAVDKEILAFKEAQQNADKKKQEVITNTQNLLEGLSARLNTALTDATSKLDSIDGVKELLKTPEVKSDKTAQAELQQYLNELKRADAAEKKITPTKMKYMLLMDTQDTLQNRFGVASEEQLSQLPLNELRSAMNELKTEQPSVANRYTQAKFNTMERVINRAIEAHPDMLTQRQQEELSLEAERAKIKQDRIIKANIKAREKELALFDNDPMKKAAFEKGPATWAAYQAQEKQQIPDDAYPVYEAMPEVSYDQKVAELERARNEYEAEMFQLEEQYPTPVAPQVSQEETANEPIPAGQQALFTKTGKPTAGALRGTANPNGVSETQPTGTVGSDVLPSGTSVAEDENIEAAKPPTLGIDRGTIGRPAGGTRTLPKAGAAPLNTEARAIKKQLTELMQDGLISRQEYSGYSQMLTRNGPEATDTIAKQALAEAGYLSPYDNAPLSRERADDLADDVPDESIDAEFDELPTESYNTNDQYFESRKTKTSSKEPRVPKNAEFVLRKETTERVTPAEMASVAEKWFNPVWYKRAVKSGMMNIIDGDITASGLPKTVQEQYKDAKALFTPEGKVYFFTKNITKGNELGVFLHEIGEHKGLENLIGKPRVTQLANRVRQMAEGKGSAKEVAMAKQAIEMAQGTSQNDKEVIAYFGEIAVFNGVRPGTKGKPEFGKALAWLNELWGAVTNALQKLHLNPEKITDKDIVDMLYGAARLEMGAAQTIQEQVGEPVKNAEGILESKARITEWELTPQERADRAAQGFTEGATPQQMTMKEKMLDTLGVTSTAQSYFDKLGNEIIGPIFAIHRKANSYYGPESFYNRTTGKLLGSLFLQHTLNANNLSFRALSKGTLAVEDKGFVKAIESDDNLKTLNEDYNNILKALEADGVSPAVAVQQAKNMILVDRYKTLKVMGEKSGAEFSDQDTREGKALQERHKALFTQWRDRYNRIRKNKIDFMVSTGVATQKQAETFMNRLEYVPLYRATGSEAADGVYMQGLLSAKQKQKLTFDTKDYVVSDIMTNIAKNEMWLYKQAVFNHATNLLVDQVQDMGGGSHVKVKNPDDKQVISYLRDGELQFFRFDDPNDMAALYSVPVINNAATKILSGLGGILRKGITLTPSFIYRQVWQDAERTWAQSGTNQPFVKMLGESIRQQAKNIKNETSEATALRDRGVIGAVEFQDSFDNAIDELFGRDKTDTSLKGKAYKAVEFMERMAQNSDLAARAVVYNAAIKEGATEGEAALRAQTMLNYQHRGTSPLLRTLLSTIPFINTQIQSNWRLVEAIQGKIPGLPKEKARQLLAAKMMKMALLTTAYALTRTGDDDYERASDENRNRNFLLNVGGVPLRIPVAPEYMLVKAVAEQGARAAIDAEFYENRKIGHAVGTSIANLLLGPSDLTPAVFTPLIENATNYSFFNDRQLVGTSLQGRATNLQFTEQTSELAKFISDGLQEMGIEAFQVSPIKLDNLINGLFGTMGRDVIFATNQLADAISEGEKADLKPNQYFEVGTAFYDTEGNQRVSDFYKTYDKITTAYNSFNSLKKSDPERAKEFLDENRKLIAARAAAESVKNNLDTLREQRNRIVNNKEMSGEEKRSRIDQLTRRANEIVTAPNKRLKEMIE